MIRENPYHDEQINTNSWIRSFDISETVSEEYVWHRDKKDRIVTVLEGEGWKLQLDEELPRCINIGDKLFIAKDQYHRLLQGFTSLKIKIQEIAS